MELDPRIKDRKYIFDCFNADEAKKYIGKKCYVTDWFERFENIEWTGKGTLLGIDDDGHFVAEHGRFGFCLPIEFVESNAPKEKRYRPYTFMEFCEKFTVGRPIKFRQKGKEGYERYLILNGYRHEQHKGKTNTFVCIGPGGFSLEELFNEYEWQEHYTEDFEPFGVEVKE